ncbi:hypothetical protein G6016_03585 [Dietzia aerolata]|uniref:Uncharacterized protein n=1 Tax=Dietzia aerolata TaxID=595984 RepID=A0ABV5JSL7_9ACTN|nr:hypothetical protein [Dietzia aerolata]MBB0968055.1 hypothetical protein [Dietzia aerolata]
MTPRTFARSAAVLGAATALTVAGAGAAMATTHNSNVDGNDVSVTFKLDGGLFDADFCGAVLAQTSEAAGVAAEFAGAVNEGSLLGILKTLNGNDSVTVLKTDGILIDSAVAPLTLANRTNTVYAEDVPSNTYALVSVCVSEPTKPTINPFVIVGDPLEAVMGSVDSLSASGDGLDTLSSVLDSDDESGAGALLSSALGETDGEGDGDALGNLSSALGDDDTATETETE